MSSRNVAPSKTDSPARPRRRGHLSVDHPIADAARRNCDAHGVPLSTRLGRVACGRCWERAIRDDERAVVEFGLPRELVPDPAYVDWVAVERVLRGDRVVLTAAEKRAAVGELARRRISVTAIAERIGTTNRVARRLLDAGDGQVGLDGEAA